MKLKSNPTLLLLVALFVAAGTYWYFFQSPAQDAPLTTSSSSDNAAEQQFQSLVSQLQPISFNTSIFSDPRFMALVDLSTSITPEASGRLDPFAPVSGVAGGI
jgi:hypothetical protein